MVPFLVLNARTSVPFLSVFFTIKEMFPLDFRLYLVVGGMPAAVAKYGPENKLYLNEIFDLIPPELSNQNKRFILKKIE